MKVQFEKKKKKKKNMPIEALYLKLSERSIKNRRQSVTDYLLYHKSQAVTKHLF